MKYKITIYVAITLCSLLFSSVQAQKSAKNHSAVISFERNVYDYDTIMQGADGTCVFLFTNIGDEPLMISDVNASCGCTKPSWSKKPIMPGERGSIRVTYNTQLIGHFRKTLVVHTNAANGNGNQVLRIKGFVRPKLM